MGFFWSLGFGPKMGWVEKNTEMMCGRDAPSPQSTLFYIQIKFQGGKWVPSGGQEAYIPHHRREYRWGFHFHTGQTSGRPLSVRPPGAPGACRLSWRSPTLLPTPHSPPAATLETWCCCSPTLHPLIAQNLGSCHFLSLECSSARSLHGQVLLMVQVFTQISPHQRNA